MRVHHPQALAAEAGQEDGVADRGDAARARIARRPDRDGLGEALAAIPLALDDRPAVIAAGLDAVQLVPGVLAEFTGPHRAVAGPRDSLDVAVPEGPHGRSEGIAWCRIALRRESQDLAAERVRVLCGVVVLRVARRDIEEAVRSEGETAAVVRAVAGDAREDDLGVAQRVRTGLAEERHPHHPVVALGTVIRVQPPGAAIAVQRESVQARLSSGDDARHRAHPAHVAGRGQLEDRPIAALRDQRSTVFQWDDRPRRVEPRCQGRHAVGHAP